MLGDAIAEDRIDELFEVLRRFVIALRLRFDQPGQAFEVHFLGQIADVVLERIRHPRVEHADPALAHVHLEILAHQLVEDVIVIFVMARTSRGRRCPR